MPSPCLSLPDLKAWLLARGWSAPEYIVQPTVHGFRSTHGAIVVLAYADGGLGVDQFVGAVLPNDPAAYQAGCVNDLTISNADLARRQPFVHLCT